MLLSLTRHLYPSLVLLTLNKMADVVKNDDEQAERGSLLRRVSSGHYEHVDRSNSPNEEPSRTGATGSTTAVDETSEGQGEEKERPMSKYAPKLRRAVRTLQHLKTFTSSYDFNRSGAGAEYVLHPSVDSSSSYLWSTFG